ncbi:restriction endonuclease subunit S [Paenibacillus residui]|uniref:Restriction endonuclease subunit S n=1 Tax=Paenibacillus residui TaxID=629724 RepID=A0ABW3DB13_9BACL
MAKKCKLKEIASISAGSTAPDNEYFGNEGYPFIRVSHLDDLLAGIDINTIPKISEKHAEALKLKKVRKGTLLLAKSGMSCLKNRVYQCTYDSYVVNHLATIDVKNELADPSYICYFLRWFNVSKLIVDESYPSIRTSAIGEIEIYLPEMTAQKTIVTLLSKAQALIDKRKQAIAKLDELVKAVFLDMFGDPVKNPYKFEVVQMESLLDFLTSGSRGWAQHFASSGDLFITIKNVKNGKLWLDDVIYVKAPNTKEAERTRVKNKDLLLSITADLGRTAVVDEYTAEKGAYINQHLSILRLNHRCNPFYVSHYLESAGGKIQFASLDQVGVKSGLNFNAIKSLNVILPPIDEQNRFEAVLKKIEKEKEKQSQSLQQLESNFQALLQKAFKGELTVKDGVTV